MFSVRGFGLNLTVSAPSSWIQWCGPGWSYRAATRQPEQGFLPLLFCIDNLKNNTSCLCLHMQTVWWLIPPFWVTNFGWNFLKVKINMYKYSFLSANEGDSYHSAYFLLCHWCNKEPVLYFVLWFSHLYVGLVLCNLKISSLSLSVHIYKCRINIYK